MSNRREIVTAGTMALGSFLAMHLAWSYPESSVGSVSRAVTRLAHQDIGNEAANVERIRAKYAAESEVRQWDGTRVDLLSEQFAIEVDWPHKWAEAIGQALYYSHLSGKPPAIVLLLRGERDREYIYRCQTVCAAHQITLFVEPAK